MGSPLPDPPRAMACTPWPVDMSACKGWAADPGDWTPAQNQAVAWASEILWRLTAGRYGTCLVKVRPCMKRCTDMYGGGEIYASGPGWGDSAGWGTAGVSYGWFAPLLYNGDMYNISCGCPGDCECVSVCKVELPGPAWLIEEVKQDGAVLDPSDYRLAADYKTLWRVDGDCWPLCQNMSALDTEQGTFSVTYQRGRPVPAGSMGSAAASTLACELARLGSAECQIPERVTQVQRDGMTYTLVDPMEFLKEGRTGVARVDMWLAMVNPDGLRSRPQVWSPDLPQTRAEWLS
ncbi:hypothetical protein ACIBG8_54250 [Nonomuraea sp. NPDC050556]|uniref:hypothetical protein n=1 Tax=Nonomuraea sp. NPDC050556 TaxID=3364369 RepID=UPI00378E94E4